MIPQYSPPVAGSRDRKIIALICKSKWAMDVPQEGFLSALEGSGTLVVELAASITNGRSKAGGASWTSVG